MFVFHARRFPYGTILILVLALFPGHTFAQVEVSGSANHIRYLESHANAGNERLDVLGIGTDPDDATTFFVCQTNTSSNCPSSDPLHVYVHNTSTNQWVFEGSIDHTRSVNIGCVAVDGDTLAIGRTFGTNHGEDGVDVYRRGAGGVWTPEASLRPIDNFPGNRFGVSVSLDGDRMAIGASRDDPDDDVHAWEGKGSVYIYDRVNSVWALTEKITTSDGSQGDDFGASVAIRSTPDGWKLVVGAPDHCTDPGGINLAGALYAFLDDGSRWQQTAKAVLTTDSHTSGQFGGAGIGFDGEIVASLDGGDLHLFEMNNTGQLMPIGALTGTDALSDPAVVGRTAIVGDPTGSLGLSNGLACIATISVSPSHQITPIARPAPVMFQASDGFGESVAFNGDVILAGAPYFDGVGENAGAIWSDPIGSVAYPSGLILEGQAAPLAGFGQAMDATDAWVVLATPGAATACSPHTTGSVRILRSEDGAWIHFDSIDPPTSETGDAFGHAATIDGNRMVVTMPGSHGVGASGHIGAVVVYEFDGMEWNEVQIIHGPPMEYGFGRAVALSGSHLAVGSPDHPSGGLVTLYERMNDGLFHAVTDLTSGSAASGARFGSVVSLAEHTLLVGAPETNAGTGQVWSWVFDTQSGVWTGGTQVQPPQLAPGTRFGAAIVQTAERAIIGLPGNATVPGAVAIYPRTTQGFDPPMLISATATSTSHGFGATLAANQNQLLIGHDAPDATQAHFLVWNGSDYQLIQTISVPSGDPTSGFGAALSMGANSLFVGAPNEIDALGHRTGRVHHYEAEIRFTVPECEMAMGNDRIQWIEDDTKEQSEHFAYAAEVDGGYAIMGSPYENYSFIYNGVTINGNNAGKATIFERTGPRAWSPVAIFRGGNFDDPIGFTHSDWLGTSVDIERSTAVAGGPQARFEQLPFASGSIRIYERRPGGWSETGEFFPPDPDQPGGPYIRGFGQSVDLDSTGSLLAVGAPNSATSATGSGAGYVYERTGSGWLVSHVLIPQGSNGGDHIGNSVSVEADWVALGAEDDDRLGTTTGAVHLYKRLGPGNWLFHSTIVSPTGTSSGRFGAALELSRSELGLTLVVSTPGELNNAVNGVGAVFVYVLDEPSQQWALTQRIDPQIVTTSVAYGTDVSIEHNTIAIGAPYLHDLPASPSRWSGGVELFNLDTSTGQFVYRTTIRPEPAQWGTNNGWGRSVGLSGGTVFIGTEWADGEPFLPSNVNMNYGAIVAHDIVCMPDCPADTNGDGRLDFFDVSLFITAFRGQQPSADFDGNGTVDFFDINAFLTAFAAGC